MEKQGKKRDSELAKYDSALCDIARNGNEKQNKFSTIYLETSDLSISSALHLGARRQPVSQLGVETRFEESPPGGTVKNTDSSLSHFLPRDWSDQPSFGWLSLLPLYFLYL